MSSDRMNQSPNRALWWWVLAGSLAWLFLPWYAVQDGNGLLRVLHVFSGPEAGSGLLQAATQGRTWLWVVPAGLAPARRGASDRR